jgi:DNA-binding CsgD family transcriptional regulator
VVSLSSEQLRLLRAAQDRLASAWSEDRMYDAVCGVMTELVPGTEAGLLLWDGPALTVARLAGTTSSLSGTMVPWFSSGLISSHRAHDPRKRDPLANRVVDVSVVARRSPATYQLFLETGLWPLGFEPFARVPFFQGRHFVAFCGMGRARGDRRFTSQELAMVQSLAPLLADGMAARQALDSKHLAPGDVAAIANAIDAPAFIVASGGQVVFANQIARAVYPKLPEWIAACCSEHSPNRPPWVKRVPLNLEGTRLYLLLPTELDVDPETAPGTPWAVRWKLPARHARVAACVLLGLSDKEIAQRLGIEFHTARTYVRRVFEAAGVHSRTELVRAAMRVARGG